MNSVSAIKPIMDGARRRAGAPYMNGVSLTSYLKDPADPAGPTMRR